MRLKPEVPTARSENSHMQVAWNGALIFKDSKKTVQVQQISRNAYRILGLSAQARWSEISQRASVLRRAAKVGIRQPSGWNLEWYEPVEQDERSIADALGRLSNPDQRLKEKLFWVSQTDSFLSGIPTRGIGVSIQSLSEPKFAESEHDAAVLALISCVSADPKIQDPDRWKTMLRLWIVTSASDAFWAFFIANEQAGQFEPSSDDRDFDRVRDETLSLALEPVAELIRNAISQSEFDRARRGLDLIRNASLSPTVLQPFEEAVLGPYENSFAQICKDIAKGCWEGIKRNDASREANVQPCSGAASRWKQEVKPRFHDFIAMAGADSSAGIRVAEEYAEFLTSLANAHTWADRWIHGEKLLNEACRYLPMSGAVRERVEATHQQVAGAADRQRAEKRNRQAAANENAVKRFVELCESITFRLGEAAKTNRPGCIELRHVEQAHEEYKQQIAPWLAILTATHGTNRDICKRAQNAAATCLFGLAVEFSYSGDFAQAKFLLAKAFVLVVDNQVLETSISKWQANVASSERKKDPPAASSERKKDPPQAKSSRPGIPASTFKGRKLGLKTLSGIAVTVLVLLPIAGLRSNEPSERAVESAQVPERPEESQQRLNKEHEAVSPHASIDATPSYVPGPILELGPKRKRRAVTHGKVVPVLDRSSAIDNRPESESSGEVREPFSLLTGTNLIQPNGTDGLGELTISNRSSGDAVIKLKTEVDSIVRRLVYIRENDAFRISDVPPGTYLLQFTRGQDWDTEVHAFRRNKTFAQFGKVLVFAEEPTGKRSIRYSTFRITLRGVPNGNVRRQAISSADFAEGINNRIARGTR